MVDPIPQPIEALTTGPTSVPQSTRRIPPTIRSVLNDKLAPIFIEDAYGSKNPLTQRQLQDVLAGNIQNRGLDGVSFPESQGTTFSKQTFVPDKYDSIVVPPEVRINGEGPALAQLAIKDAFKNIGNA